LGLASHLPALVVTVPARLARSLEHAAFVAHPSRTRLEVASPGCAAGNLATDSVDLQQ
jgi:hypothetical protein